MCLVPLDGLESSLLSHTLRCRDFESGQNKSPDTKKPRHNRSFNVCLVPLDGLEPSLLSHTLRFRDFESV